MIPIKTNERRLPLAAWILRRCSLLAVIDDRSLRAAFTKVSALGIEEQRVNAVLDFAERDSRVGHGFRVVAELTVWECENCLQVPIGALFRSAEQWTVFRLADGRLWQTGVEIGRMNDKTAQVLGGLSSSDIVVVHPADTLFDGELAERRE